MFNLFQTNPAQQIKFYHKKRIYRNITVFFAERSKSRYYPFVSDQQMLHLLRQDSENQGKSLKGCLELDLSEKEKSLFKGMGFSDEDMKALIVITKNFNVFVNAFEKIHNRREFNRDEDSEYPEPLHCYENRQRGFANFTKNQTQL